MVRFWVLIFLASVKSYGVSSKTMEMMVYIEKYGIEKIGKHNLDSFKTFEKRWGENNLKSFSISKLKKLSAKYGDENVKQFGVENLSSFELRDLKKYGVKLLGNYELSTLKRFKSSLLKKATQVQCTFAKEKCDEEDKLIRWFELEKNYKAKKVCEVGAKIILKMKFCKILNLK